MLDHPFLIGLKGTFQTDSHIYFIMDYACGGELFTLLRKEGQFLNDVALFYTVEAVLALEYMHSLNVVYRDMKPENLLIGADGHLKITDFGFAKVVTDRTYTLCGTPEYIAPEVIKNEGHGKSADWWALGILIYEMLIGTPPFYDNSPMKIYEKILEGDLFFPCEIDVRAINLIKKLLISDPKKRLNNAKVNFT